MSTGRYALLIGNTEHQDRSLAELPGPEDRLPRLARLLRRETCGSFLVKTLRNRPSHAVRRQVEEFFARAEPDDVLLVYVLGLGLVGEDGAYHAATVDTDPEEMDRTALSAAFVAGCMDASRCENQVLIVDCHHTRWLPDAEEPPESTAVGLVGHFEGNGRNRVILGASDSFHHARTAEGLEAGRHASRYCALLTEALECAEVDADDDGLVTVDELTDYVHGRLGGPLDEHRPVKELGAGAHGDLIIARCGGRPDPETLPKCFIVSHLSGEAGERAAEVYERYIVPACRRAGFRPWRSDMQRSPFVVPEILSSLKTDPMVVAYLGRPSWNPNVMIEVGYRLATGLPVVMVREQEVEEDEPPLPFDLKDHRVIYLLDEGEEPDAGDRLEACIDEIAAVMVDRRSHRPWESPHPVATISLNTDTGEGVFLESSEEADELFDAEDGLTGQELRTVVERLAERMPPQQFRVFHREQETLVATLMAKLASRKGFFGQAEVEVPVATRPIVFMSHKLHEERYRDRMYLPVVVEYSKQGADFRMKLLYLDVSGMVEVEDDEGLALYRCDLTSGTGGGPRPPGWPRPLEAVRPPRPGEPRPELGGSGRPGSD